ATLLAGGTALALASPASAQNTSPQTTLKTTEAAAPLCTGAACDGLDPEASGCDAGATTVDSAATGFGTEELRFSSICQTSWIRLTGYPGGGTLNFSIADITSGTEIGFSVPTPVSAGPHFSNMIYAPSLDCVEAAVFHNGIQIGSVLKFGTC